MAVAAVDAGRCVADAGSRWVPEVAAAHRWSVVAVGKAAAPMLRACLAAAPRPPASALLIAPATDPALPSWVEQQVGGHPVPNAGSVAGGERALALAAGAAEDDLLLVLLSGGASALMAAPVAGVSLEDKRETTARLLRAGADIHELNAVRKHLSRVKGGRLAAASQARTLCLAISDVVGDDVSVIGSGPAVADPSSCDDALGVLDRRGGRGAFPPSVVNWLVTGARDSRAMHPGGLRLRSETVVIGNAARALDGARDEARRRGYAVFVESEPVCGEARDAAAAYAARLADVAAAHAGACCVLSAGETTVRVVGRGRGGRNQEFALALAAPLAAFTRPVVVASMGTDGVDGPTDAAGAVVDASTMRRAGTGRDGIAARLADNDAYAYFAPLGDLIVTGPTGTNVGDIQVALLAERP